jgi:probable HAF family extracellular repeat protein
MARAVNGPGQIVGETANGATPTHAWIWFRNPDGTLENKDLGVLSGGTVSHAAAINNRGQVVGTANVSGGATIPFIWVPGWTAIKDLRSFLSAADQAIWTQLQTATGISDDGTVVGTGMKNGVSVGFTMRPK